MVNEEDFCAPIKDFLKEIIQANHHKDGHFPLILHGKSFIYNMNL